MIGKSDQSGNRQLKGPAKGIGTAQADRTGPSLAHKALWACIIGWVIRITLFERSRSNFSTVDVAAGVQVLLVLITFAILIVSGLGSKIILQTSRTSFRPLFLYFVVCAFSAVWSPLPAFSLYRAIEFAVMLLATIAALSYRPNLEKAENLVFLVSFTIILATISLLFKNKDIANSMEFWHTNSYSASSAMVFLYCIGEYFRSEKARKKKLKWVGLAALGFTILGTSSASFISVLAALLVTAILYRNKALIIIGSITLFMSVTLYFFGGMDLSVLMPYLFPGKLEHEVTDLGGRTRIWGPLWEHFTTSPIFGHGFAVIARPSGKLFASDPHNSIFSVLIGTGIIGLLIVLAYFYRMAKELVVTTAHRCPGAVGCAGAFAAGIINSMAMPLIFAEWEESSVVYACFTGFFIFYVLRPFRDQQAEQRKGKNTSSLLGRNKKPLIGAVESN